MIIMWSSANTTLGIYNTPSVPDSDPANCMETKNSWMYSGPSILRPPMEQRKSGLILQVLK